MIKSKLYSRSSRSWTMSMCSKPKNPHRNPKPIAVDASGSYCIKAFCWWDEYKRRDKR